MRRAGRSKYSAIPTIIDGIRFASRKEAHRYQELRLLLKAGLIRDLELQPEFPCVVNGALICRYLADFRYVNLRNGEVITEDTKGFVTPEYRLKKKLVEALTDTRITEV